MLEHDLTIVEKHRFHCSECNGEIDHHTQETEWKVYDGEPVLVLVMRCRLCWNELDVPAQFLNTGILEQLVVKR